jgi:hypothetical protein
MGRSASSDAYRNSNVFSGRIINYDSISSIDHCKKTSEGRYIDYIQLINSSASREGEDARGKRGIADTVREGII